MPSHRPLRAIVLFGGWLLLFNPDAHRPGAPLSAWKKVREYDSAYLCQQKRHEEILAALEKDAKHAAPGSRMTPTDAELRYRCERTERVPRGR